MQENTPELWRAHWPVPDAGSHKYTRGHAIISAGPISCAGATRIAARAALRAGAGLVSVACTPDTLPLYAASFAAIMTKPVTGEEEYRALIADPRVTALLAGPGAGATADTRMRVLTMLAAGKSAVIDADGLNVFAGDLPALQNAINAPAILTPHAGEFARLFGEGKDPRETQALAAAKRSGAVVVLKGAETIIASPDGRIALNRHASPYLATAGSGDALAGIVTGLLAQGMPAFEAACAGVWLHGDVALRFGPGLIAEDIAEDLPESMRALAQDGQI